MGRALLGVALVSLGAAACTSEEARRNARIAEAETNLEMMELAARAYYERVRALPNGAIRPAQYPATSLKVPATPPCGSTRGDFSGATFKALGFAPRRVSLQYQFVSEGIDEQAVFVVRAVGDLDCDGRLTTFERVGKAARRLPSIYCPAEIE